MGPLYHSPGVQSYCAPTDNLSLAGHYTDMRNSAAAGWYGSTASDPRFASKLKLLKLPSIVTTETFCSKWFYCECFSHKKRV